MTQAETKILEHVRGVNTRGGLAGLPGGPPGDPRWGSKSNRFVRRLHEAGRIVWVEFTHKYGAGWAVPDLVEQFKNKE